MREAAALNRRLGIEAGYLDPAGKRKAAPRATISRAEAAPPAQLRLRS